MSRVLAFFVSVWFLIDMFFVGIIPDKKIEITGSADSVEYYVDGESENGLLKYGVIGLSNLFEPGEEVKIVIECRDEKLFGERMQVSVSSEQADFNKRGYVVFDSTLPYNTFSFSSEKNGIFTVKTALKDGTEYSFNIGIMPRNAQADCGFYYGIQPYITRSLLWGEGFCIPGFSGEESVDLILNTAEFLGVNLIREDSVGWGAMQSEAYGNVDFSKQDFLIDKVNSHGMKYNWILGFNAGEWSVSEKYKADFVEADGWRYPPDEEIWLDFVTKAASHYSDNTDILWEIWNEPNWEFFKGTKEEYFSLLEKTSSVLKDENPDSFVYSGGLAVAEKESNLPYYQKSAELIREGLLDTFGYHNHDGIDTYYEYMTQMTALTESAGLSGGFNSESGIWGADASLIACKALYTRAMGADGFVSFSFRKTVTPENDINEYAFFNEYLQPSDAVLSYSTVIHFLGNAEFISSISNKKDLIIDEYNKNGKKIEVYYSLGEKTKITAPEGNFSTYDMYGNTTKTGKKLSVTNEPIYIVYE